MPPDELDRLKDIVHRPRRTHLPDPPKAEAQVEVSMPPPPPPRRPKRESLRAAKDTIKQAAENPWVKLVLALVVGGGAGGIGGRTLAALNVVMKPELEAEKKRSDDEREKMQKRIETLEQAVQKQKDSSAQDHTALYLTSRYLYFVLPKLGVLVTLPPGAELRKMEFHPAPVMRGPLGPNDAKPIQPAETLPLPPEH